MLAQLPLPLLAEGDNPFDHFGQFHENLRDVVAWAPFVVDAAGAADPSDARLVKAFLDGPFAWHLADEELHLLPLLAGRRGTWLDAALATVERGHREMNAAARLLLVTVDPLIRGDRVPLPAWREAVGRFALTVDHALAFEDVVLLPTARLVIEDDDRLALTDALLVAQRHRPAALDLSSRVPRVAAGVRTHRADGSAAVRVFADCPRGRTVSVTDVCASCRHLEGMRIDDGDGCLVCAIEPTPLPRRVADIMTREVECVQTALPVPALVRMFGEHGVHGFPVVDDAGAPRGVVSQSDVMRALAQGGDLGDLTVADVMMHVAFTVDENATIDDAATLIAFEGVHRLPVVNAERVVVGIVSAMDVVRAVSRASAR